VIGVARRFQVSEYGANAEFNMSSTVFANDTSRPQLGKESIYSRPEMARVSCYSLFAATLKR